jgi:hypothetical protein
VCDLGVKVQRLINGFHLERMLPKSIFLEVEDVEPLDEGTIRSSIEEIEDTVLSKEGVGGSSLEEHVSVI